MVPPATHKMVILTTSLITRAKEAQWHRVNPHNPTLMTGGTRTLKMCALNETKVPPLDLIAFSELVLFRTPASR